MAKEWLPSLLVDYTKLSPYHSNGRTADVYIITPHCTAGVMTHGGLGSWFSSPDCGASCNYGIDKDGNVVLICDEKNKSWCTNSDWNDQRAITIECSSDKEKPHEFNDVNKVYNKLVALCVDICERYGKKKLVWANWTTKEEAYRYVPADDEMVLTVHRWWANKSCPGDWFHDRIGRFAIEVTEKLGKYRGQTVPSGYYTDDYEGDTGSGGGSSGGGSSGGGSSSSTPSSGSIPNEYLYKGRTDNYVIENISSVPSDIIGNNDIRTKIEKLDNFISKQNDLTAFVYFEVNGFKLDTRSPDTKKHYIVSLENQKTGAGQGNKFTIKIVYQRDFVDREDFKDINNFEKALSYARKRRNACILRYGYLMDDENQSTTEYHGMLLQYDVTANKQIVEYTLYGVSGEQTSSLATVNWYPRLDGVAKDDIAYINMQETSIDAASKATPEELSAYEAKVRDFNKAYANPIKINPFDALCRFVYDYNYFLNLIHEDNQSKNPTVTKFEIVDETGLGKIKVGSSYLSALTTYLQPVNITVCRNQTAIEYIQYLIGLFQKKDDDLNGAMLYYLQNNEVVDRFVYEFKYDSTSEGKERKIKIVIRRLDSTDTSCAYEFKNYYADNRMLLDFTLKYDGTVALAARSEYSGDISEDDDNDKRIYINSDGKIVSKAIITKEMFVAGSLEETTVKSANRWLDNISCSNNCTMRTVGMPFEIPVGTIFKIQSYIGDTIHHTSGRCYTVGVVDKIQNNMFTTNFTMVRLPGADNDIID